MDAGHNGCSTPKQESKQKFDVTAPIANDQDKIKDTTGLLEERRNEGSKAKHQGDHSKAKEFRDDGNEKEMAKRSNERDKVNPGRSKDHSRFSRDAERQQRSPAGKQHHRDHASASERSKSDIGESKGRSSQYRHDSPEPGRDRCDRQASPTQRTSSDRDRHTHFYASTNERHYSSSRHRSHHDTAAEAPKQQRSRHDSSGHSHHQSSKGASPRADNGSRSQGNDRPNFEKGSISPPEQSRKRSREQGANDGPDERHGKADLDPSFAKGTHNDQQGSRDQGNLLKGQSNKASRGAQADEAGREHRKRHMQEPHGQAWSESAPDRGVSLGGGTDAAAAREREGPTGEGSRPPAMQNAAGELGGGNAHKTGKEKKAPPKVNLSFDEELAEDEDSAAPSATFNLAATTASRFEQERQKAHSRVTVAPSAAPSVVANNLRMQMDDDGALGPRGAGAQEREPAGSLGRVFIGVAQAKVARPYMEDRHTIVASYLPCSSNGTSVDDGICRCFAAVYDGHNGCHAADLAASRLHLMIASDPALRIYSGSTGPPSLVAQEEQAIRTALRKAFREIDDDILKTARAESLRDGSTALLVLRLGQVLYAAHAGDSRAVLCRGGLAERLTEDHKPNLPVERHRIQNVGGRVEFQRCWRVIVEPRDGRPGSALAVSRSLGDLDFKEPQRLVECEPDVTRTQLQSTDSFVVLATDGLWDMLSDQDAVDCARATIEANLKSSGRGPSDAMAGLAAEALLHEAIRRGTMDNTTVIVLLLQWD